MKGKQLLLEFFLSMYLMFSIRVFHFITNRNMLFAIYTVCKVELLFFVMGQNHCSPRIAEANCE